MSKSVRVAGLCLLLIVPAAVTLSQAQSHSPQPQVRVRTVDTEAILGSLVSLSTEKGLKLEIDGEERHIDLADLVSIAQTSAQSRLRDDQDWETTAGREGAAIEWADGDRIIGRLGEGQSEIMQIESDVFGTLKVPLEGVAAVLFYSAGMPAYADSLAWFRREPESPDDRLLLTNGDVVRGFILGVGREGVRVEVDDKESTIPLRLAVAARLVHPPVSKPKGVHAAMTLVDGQRLTVAEMDWSAAAVRARTIRNERIEPAPDRVHGVEFFGGRWEWLSDRAPAKFEHVPMLSREWKFSVDRNVLGGPLRVAGTRFARGFGVHSRSILTFDLGGQYREFVTLFGIDDDSGQGADVRVAVIVDGQQRLERTAVVRGKLHGPIRIDVGGAKQLSLEVDFGRNGDIQDRFDWIEPGLVR